MYLRTVIVATLALAMCAPALAQRKKLAVGDPAPALNIDKWVKGDETAIESGQVYVVEFWATWCGPCKKSIPHLTKLQQELRADDVTIIGVSSEKPDVVNKFVRSQGNGMDYTIAVDNRNQTTRSWMGAAGLKGIPAAFIVDRSGKIQFIGSPFDEQFDDVLEQVAMGRYDQKLMAKAKPHLDAAKQAHDIRNWRLYEKHMADVIALDDKVFAAQMLEVFETYIVDQDNADRAYEYADELIATKVDDPEFLGWLAADIVLNPKYDDEDRRLDVAMQAAETALSNARRTNDPRYLAVEALVTFHRGDIDRAVQLQKQAYFQATPRKKELYKVTLQTYQDARNRAQGASGQE